MQQTDMTTVASLQSSATGKASPSRATDGLRPIAAVELGDLRGIGLIATQLGLILAVIYQFELESRTFFQVMALAAVGFVVHALLPLRHRLTVFVGLSGVSVILALGVYDGLSLIALGLVLIGICHLPLALWGRVLLLLAVGSLYAAWRIELIPAPWSVSLWPILAAMFMFRLALYLHALNHGIKNSGPLRVLAYFFMIPNVCFPLYPVVDYATFVRTYYDRNALQIYETGIRWIVRGMIHLLLYRFVYLYLVEDPNNLTTLGDLIQFMVATFLLYLRVSGQFHIITGVLHLFGFRLPETHHLYYLSSGFTDFWRRINIYWKDFMMKLVFYPCYFWLRRWGDRRALVGATIVVFLVTWTLHSYQWFWLRGSFPVEIQDALFWGILGTLVVIGALREMTTPPKRSLSHVSTWSLSRAVRTVTTFVVICVIWSMWSSESLSGWLVMWIVAGNVAPGELLTIAGLVVVGLLVAGRDWSTREIYDSSDLPLYRTPAVTSTALLLALLALGQTQVYERGLPQVAETVASLQGTTLNARDETLQHKGYYEKLDNASRMSAQLWSIQAQKPLHWVGLSATEAYVRTDDFELSRLRPNSEIVFFDKSLTVNRWGMRDRDYTPAKPPGTYRIAVTGPSMVMGSGVADGETLSDFLEMELNRRSAPGVGPRFEVLNFGEAGKSVPSQMFMVEKRVLQLSPDVVLTIGNPRLMNSAAVHMLKVVSRDIPIPYPELDALVRESGVRSLAGPGFPVPFERLRTMLDMVGFENRMPWREASHRLRLIQDRVARTAFDHIARVVREQGAVPIFVGFDNVVDRWTDSTTIFEEARAAGFLVFDLLDVWAGLDQEALRVAPWDKHPNADGNRVAARALAELLVEHRSELGLEGAFQ